MIGADNRTERFSKIDNSRRLGGETTFDQKSMMSSQRKVPKCITIGKFELESTPRVTKGFED